jgi:hypothetical protein
MSSEEQDNTGEDRTNSRSDVGVLHFLNWYGTRKRRGMQSDARLSLGNYLVKIGLIFAFILIDLVFFPSLIQIFLPISFYFFVAWAVGVIALIFAEKEILDRTQRKKSLEKPGEQQQLH